ncbi:MAG: prolipoprotein diacylglyceryl transferase [Candidatus Gastranaerophilales bacterium]|nr:prolipoprotein diacylglyceryl transferase [Candidatus Gastranaerophilales bacterium]
MFASPGVVAFSVFNYPIHWYGIIMALSILTGLYVISLIRRKFYASVPADFVLDLAFYVILGGVLGARIYYVLADYAYYSKFPMDALAIWHGGLSIHGAIIGGITVAAIVVKRYKQNFLQVADLLVYGLVVGQIIGRWGNFFNSEAFGLPCSLPWKLFIPKESRPVEFYNVDFFHPTFLYESLISIFIFFILFFVVRKLAKGKDGVIFFSYMMMYGVSRIFVESIRIDSVLNLMGLPIAVWVSVLFLIIGAVGVSTICKQSEKHVQI